MPAPTPAEDLDAARTRVLNAAEELFYARGIQAVGIDQIRDRAGVSLKRLYQLFETKDQLVEAYLVRRDRRWLDELKTYVDRHADAHARIFAVFDFLEHWFAQPGFRGCAWINAHGELGAVTPVVAEEARAHKTHFKTTLAELVRQAGAPQSFADDLYLVAEGAMVTAGIFGTPTAATQARSTAQRLLGSAYAVR
jgi:AcrR family transcriptional regulator